MTVSKITPVKQGRSKKPAEDHLRPFIGKPGMSGRSLPPGCPTGSIDEIFQWMATKARDVDKNNG